MSKTNLGFEAGMVNFMREQIAREVRKNIAHDMEESLVKEYVEKIRPEINKIVKKISIEQLSTVYSMTHMKNELFVTVENKNDTQESP